MDKIVIKGAREHNLKNIDVEIPKNKLVVFTGLSGSGKSSLAFDTIYAEGQRRYVESLSSYARQFLGIMSKPDVDYIAGLSPAISIDQKGVSHNPRSTVGTITEIYDYLRLLFARIGHPHCQNCGREISHQTIEQIVDSILEMAKKNYSRNGLRILILAPIVRDRKGEYSGLFTDLMKKGYHQARIDGIIRSLDEDLILIKTNKHSIDALIDRLVLSNKIKEQEAQRGRLRESLEAALKLGEDSVIIAEIMDKSFDIPASPKQMHDHLFSQKFACPNCNISISEIEPRTFSFNSPHGACSRCSGLGNILEIDPKLVINPNLSLAEGGILPWSRLATTQSWFLRLLESVATKFNFSLNSPIGNLPDNIQKVLLYGIPNEIFAVRGHNRFGRAMLNHAQFEGVIPNLERRYKETESEYIRTEIEKYMRIEICPVCHGARLKQEALSITVDEKSIWEISKMSVKNAILWSESLKNNDRLNHREKKIAEPILKELQSRLIFLSDVGLDYLTIERSSGTLAGGEAQRIRLASQIGSGLSGVLYVLDEPTIGLHERDNHRLIETLKKLQALGNSIIVVEHDRDMMLSSDWILDFGPKAGEHGGEVIACGSPKEIMKNPASLTGQYLSGRKKVTSEVSHPERGDSRVEGSDGKLLTVLGAKEHNLKNIRVDFPLGKFVAVTGVSGSGKSTLVNDILFKALNSHFWQSKEKPGEFETMLGQENIDKAILIDQSPIGRTPRSNPSTYCGVFTFIRDLFAQTPQAKTHGYKQGRFSFNVKGGRCEVCQGDGVLKIEMQFLPDVYITCEACGGRRYNREALEILYKDKSIADVLEMNVEEALKFFANIPSIKRKLETLMDVGLGYIRLGQPAPTLSGGEAQRVKLATELSKKSTGKTLYVLDEPTTGLHFADIERLLHILRRLVNQGNTVIVIEHNLDVVKNVDWILDLGPEGGDLGGYIVAQGTPQEIANNPKSATGHYLKAVI